MTPSSDTPMREGSRDGQGGCVMCGGDVALDARAVLYACLPAAQLPAPPSIRHDRCDECAQALQRRKALVAHTMYECGGCGERFVGERRCETCNLFCRAARYRWVVPGVRHRLFSSTTCSERG